jgi:hypothetical protein
MKLPSLDILFLLTCLKETNQMKLRKTLALAVCMFMAVSCFAQGGRGKAELKAGSGSITIDYGRPLLKGQDRLSQLQIGQAWRMGMNQATGITTPVDLTFGSTKVPKGSYSLFLKRVAADKFEMVFNSQTGQWGLTHDVSKDLFSVPMTKSALPNSVEMFTINLEPAPNGGVINLDWGTNRLSSEFKFEK